MSRKRERSHSAATSITPQGGNDAASKHSGTPSPANVPSIDLPAEDEVYLGHGNGTLLSFDLLITLHDPDYLRYFA